MTARKKWAVLRDSFRKSHKKYTTFKSGSGGKSHKKWYLYDNLLFLLPFVDEGSTSTTNLMEESVTFQDSQQESLQDSQLPGESLEQEYIMGGNLSSTSPGLQNATSLEEPRPDPSHKPNFTINAIGPKSQMAKRKRPFPQERQSSASPFDEEMLNALKGMREQQQVQQKKSLDDDEQFLLSLSPVMKSLDTISKFEFRGELNDIALRYLRRAHQHAGTHYPGHEHSSRSSTPSFQHNPSPISVSTQDSYQYHQYRTMDATAQVHEPTPQHSGSYQHSQQQQYTPAMFE